MVIKRQWKMRVKCSTRFSICKEIWNRTMVISWSWFRAKSGILSVQIVHKVNGTILEEYDVRMSKAGIQSSVPRFHCPEEGLKAKAVANCRSTDTIETVFRTVISVNQLSQKCVKNMNPITWEDPLWENSRDPCSCRVWSRQTCLWIVDDRARKDLLLLQYVELGKLSQQDRLSKFCIDAGFLNVVEIGQYFMTKDTAEFSQFTDAVACREYTLPRNEGASEPKGWIRGNTKIVPVLEVATCCLHGKYGVEIRIMSMNAHGLNKLFTNLNNEQETS